MLEETAFEELEARLAPLDPVTPPPPYARAPVHTLSVPADFFGPGVLREYGRLVRRAIAEHGPLPFEPEVVDRVLAKLDQEPVEDVRVDVADSYGVRDDWEEDAAVTRAAAALATGDRPPFFGLRCKPFTSAASRRRAARSLDLFLDTLGPPPASFVITLPAVSSVAQVEALVVLCGRLEAAHGLADGSLHIELEPDAPVPARPLLFAARGRCVALVHTVGSLTTTMGVAARFATLDNPVADHARDRLQVAASAYPPVRVVDGAARVIPVGETSLVRQAWATHAELVRRALERGVPAGWDTNPAQLASRFGATFAFYQAAAPLAVDLLSRYLPRPGSADPATVRALAQVLLRGLDCGALDEATIEPDRATLLHTATTLP